jgi:hypothetical protein
MVARLSTARCYLTPSRLHLQEFERTLADGNRGDGVRAGAGSAPAGTERPLAFPTPATLPLASREGARCRVQKR